MTSESRKHRTTVKHLFTDTKETAYKSTKKPQFTFSDIAKHAARKAQRRKSIKQDTDTPYRLQNCQTRENKSSYRMGVLGAAIARCRMICMGLPVQSKQTQWR